MNPFLMFNLLLAEPFAEVVIHDTEIPLNLLVFNFLRFMSLLGDK